MKKILSGCSLIAALFLFFLLPACKKENKCVAGQGGNVELVVKLNHHGMSIPNDSLKPDTVWVLFNATGWKNAPAGYNMMVIGEPGEDHIHVDGLRCGDYYLHGAGWDTSLNETVRGGIGTSFSTTSGEVVVEIPVSE